MTLHPTHDFGTWVAAALTLMVFSFLYRDNPFYRFAEHLFVGVSAGYYIVLNFWSVIVQVLWDPLVRAFHDAGTRGPASLLTAQLGDYRGWLIVPALLGLMLLSRMVPKVAWMSRWALAVIIGVYAGIKTTGFAQSDFIAQVQASMQPLWTGNIWSSLDAIVFTIGIATSLLFFFYSREHKGGLGVASKIGMAFLMVSFGAGYGYTVMSRVSLLIGRFQFLLEDVLGRR
jgi:hypothetical protein